MAGWSIIVPTVVDTIVKALAPAMRDQFRLGEINTRCLRDKQADRFAGLLFYRADYLFGRPLRLVFGT